MAGHMKYVCPDANVTQVHKYAFYWSRTHSRTYCIAYILVQWSTFLAQNTKRRIGENMNRESLISLTLAESKSKLSHLHQARVNMT